MPKNSGAGIPYVVLLGGVFSIFTLLLQPSVCRADEEGYDQETESLAKASQNPVANLISVPFQNNTNFGTGPADETQNILNIQPVVPFSINEDWNLITRTIAPLIWQPDMTTGEGTTFGFGDINPSLFLSSAKPGTVIWGAGPTFTAPSATDRRLGSGQWSLGPTAVILTMPGHWVIGALANNQWSVGGQSDRAEVNQMLAQYFINYNLPGGWYLTSSPSITANWKAANDDTWTVPFGGGGGKLQMVGPLPIDFQVQGFWYAETPEGGPDWTLRARVQFLFPR